MQIRHLTTQDISTVSNIIVDTLKGSLLEKLGERFTEKHFLPTALKQLGLNNYICEYQGNVIGYLLFADNQSIMRSLGQTLMPVMLPYMLLKCWRHPSLLIDAAASFFNSVDVDKKQITWLEKASYLVYFTIDHSYQGQGLGSRALTQCLETLSPEACIVESSDKRVIQFYEKHQFHSIGKRKRFFSALNLLLRKI